MIDDIPEPLLRRHPELVPQTRAILQAMKSHAQGEVVTAACPTCRTLLRVHDFESIGSLWVRCEKRCTRSHTRYEPPAEGARG